MCKGFFESALFLFAWLSRGVMSFPKVLVFSMNGKSSNGIIKYSCD